MSKQMTSKDGENNFVMPTGLIEICKSGALCLRLMRRSAQLTSLMLCIGLIVRFHYAIKFILGCLL